MPVAAVPTAHLFLSLIFFSFSATMEMDILSFAARSLLHCRRLFYTLPLALPPLMSIHNPAQVRGPEIFM
jgi:hypothetical protein